LNATGQLGIGNKENQNKPVLFGMKREEVQEIACGTHHTMIAKKNGDILVCGSNREYQSGIEGKREILKPELLMKEKQVKQICCGESHSILLEQNGQLWVWGSNDYGKFFSIICFTFNINFKISPINTRSIGAWRQGRQIETRIVDER